MKKFEIILASGESRFVEGERIEIEDGFCMVVKVDVFIREIVAKVPDGAMVYEASQNLVKDFEQAVDLLKDILDPLRDDTRRGSFDVLEGESLEAAKNFIQSKNL